MNARKVDKIILRISGCLFIGGGIIHWLIILGFLFEKAPLILGIYFHSLAVLSMVAGIGLMLVKDWGIKTAVFICITQIPAHLYMIYLDAFQNWNSGYSIPGRLIDLGLVFVCLIYLSYRTSFLNRSSY